MSQLKRSFSFCTSMMLVILLSMGMLFLHQIDAMVCSIGQKPDPSADNRYRWVIPMEDHCRCTEIQPGGVNTRTPGRNFKVVYFDISMSTAHEVHKWLNCSSGRTGSKEESSPLAIEGTPSTSGSHLTTTEAPLQIAGTACSDDDPFSAYPNDCSTVFFRCYGVWVEKTCPPGLFFNPQIVKCDYPTNCPCP